MGKWRPSLWHAAAAAALCASFCAAAAQAAIRANEKPFPQRATTKVFHPRTGAYLGTASASSLIVQFVSTATAADRQAVNAGINAQQTRYLGEPGLYGELLPSGVSPAAAIGYYESSPLVLSAHPNRLYHMEKAPNDPMVAQQYGLSQINAYGGWEWETGTSSAVSVAIMDTGVEQTHQDLSSKYDVANSSSFCGGGGCNPVCSPPGTDVIGHGTEVAGVAAAATDNGIGVAGISWGAKLVSLKVFDDSGCADDAGMIAALNYASTLQTKTGRRTVVNMSLGECDTSVAGSCGACDPVLITAVNTAISSGVVLVAAAGNQGSRNPGKYVECPAKIPGVISVGATDSNQNIAFFSAQGPEMASYGVVAPGVNVQSTSVGNTYTGGATGTSFSSPHVAGLAALILSAQPTMTVAQVTSAIRGSAELIGPSTLATQGLSPQGNAQGAGRINSFLALRLAIRGTLADFDGKQKAIAFPNPYHPSQNGTVNITVPDSLVGFNLSIKIYTIDGHLIRELTGQSWDGKNDGGNLVATGTYLFKVKTDRGESTGKIALIR